LCARDQTAMPMYSAKLAPTKMYVRVFSSIAA
jgi:hypothetical protein